MFSTLFSNYDEEYPAESYLSPSAAAEAEAIRQEDELNDKDDAQYEDEYSQDEDDHSQEYPAESYLSPTAKAEAEAIFEEDELNEKNEAGFAMMNNNFSTFLTDLKEQRERRDRKDELERERDHEL